MEIEFTYTKKEWVDGRRKYLFISKVITRMQLFVMALMAVFFIISAAVYGFGVINIALGVVLALLALELVFIYVVQPGMLYKATDKYHSRYRLVFGEDGLLFETQGIASELKWDIYTGYAQSREYYYLLQGKMNYTLIPRRALSDERGRENFEKLVKSVLPEVKAPAGIK